MATNSKRSLSGPRWFLRGICVVVMFLSAFVAAHGILMTLQFLGDDIPAGRVVSVSGPTKSGPRLRLDNGREVVVSYQVLFLQPKPAQIAVGDRVEKHPGSFVYFVNGTALTDARWMWRNWLLPTPLLVLLGVYLLIGVIYLLRYRRTPLGDVFWSDDDPKLPKRPQSYWAMTALMVGSWVVIAGLMTAFFACASGCLFGVGRAARG